MRGERTSRGIVHVIPQDPIGAVCGADGQRYVAAGACRCRDPAGEGELGCGNYDAVEAPAVSSAPPREAVENDICHGSRGVAVRADESRKRSGRSFSLLALFLHLDPIHTSDTLADVATTNASHFAAQPPTKKLRTASPGSSSAPTPAPSHAAPSAMSNTGFDEGPPKAEIITLTSVSLASSVASSREGGISPSRETPRQLLFSPGVTRWNGCV